MDKVNKIIGMLEAGQHMEAMREYNEVLKSGSPDEKFILAEEFIGYGFMEEAISLLENLLLYYPGEGEIIIPLAEAYIDNNAEEKAILLLEEIEQDDDSYGEALLLLADLYQLQGLFEVCERKLLQSKEQLPDEPVVDFALAEFYSSMGEAGKAIGYYEEVLKAQDEIAGVNVNQRIAENLSAAGAFEESLPYYEKALKKSKDINTLFGFALTAFQAGYAGAAIEKFEELKSLDPEYHSLYLYLAKSYEMEEDLQKSLETTKEGIRQDEFNKDLFFYGGKIAIKLGKEEEAEQYFREALALDPGFSEAALTLNRLFLHQERFADVADLLEAIDVDEHADPQFFWDAAVAYQGIEECGKASGYFDAAYNYYQNNEDFLKDYGYFLIEEGKTDMAAEIFKQLANKHPMNEEYADLVYRLTGDM
ncbi:tetratricopeptide repeat protein [Bacillus sp. B-jedd]|uniref:tetratricopeptide repeat protein n=1 Tax=Bacillus sp. B-jedd TaxID=1476857 RepID=UPI000515553F|nr:tetratricopeptide repeat protein [Bacillus sp. B-jedd]CEG27648.1 TPR-repeat-containing protein [Bacillus sp. B-jedd]